MRIAFRVRAIDGNGEPVADLEVGARFRYTAASSTWSTALTDGDGYARFDDTHPAPPLEACLFVGREHCITIAPVEPGSCHMLEL